MKRIIIICEGQTEQQFCNQVLYPYFLTKGILIISQLIKKTHGGIVNWQALKHQIEIQLKQDKMCYVTTLIDFYGLYPKHNYPQFAEALQKVDKSETLSIIEAGMQTDMEEDLQLRFVPYIQLYEMECMIFVNCDVIENYFEKSEINLKEIRSIATQFPNPELINNSRNTAPSKRLITNIKGYNKVRDGISLLKEIGLEPIRAKCPRFNDWITQLENL